MEVVAHVFISHKHMTKSEFMFPSDTIYTSCLILVHSLNHTNAPIILITPWQTSPPLQNQHGARQNWCVCACVHGLIYLFCVCICVCSWVHLPVCCYERQMFSVDRTHTSMLEHKQTGCSDKHYSNSHINKSVMEIQTDRYINNILLNFWNWICGAPIRPALLNIAGVRVV